MPTYKVRSNLTRGELDDDGNAQVKDYAAGDEVELTEEEAAPLLEAGTVAKGDDQRLADKEERLAELRSKTEELQAELVQVQQEIKDEQVALSRNPDREYGTLVASPDAAPLKPEADDRFASDAARQEAENSGVDLSNTEPTGSGGKFTVSDVRGAQNRPQE